MKYKILIFFAFLSCSVNAQQVSQRPLTRLLFIFDFSNSMNATWETSSRITIAKRLISNAVDSLKNVKDVEIALRLYGHQSPLLPGQQDCKDSKLEVPFGKNNHDDIRFKIGANYPKGTTPIAYSLEQAGGDFPDCKECRNVIVLITDGIEACDGDPCAIARALRSKSISVKPFIIGVGLDLSYLKQLECIGTVFDANNEAAFQNTLKVVIDQAVNNTTAQVNINDIYKKPTETNIAYTIYDQKTNKVRYNYEHTINRFGYPDTIVLDAVTTYKIVVHSIPQVVKENITLKPGVHNIIEIDAPQGTLELKVRNNNRYVTRTPAIVRKKGDMTTLNAQNIGETERYLVGDYDLEILTLPRIYMNKVEIRQSTINRIEIPAPGVLKVNMPGSGYGSIFVVEEGQQKFVCNLNPENKYQEYALQPGNYIVIYRNKKRQRTMYTVEKKFSIISSQSITLTL